MAHNLLPHQELSTQLVQNFVAEVADSSMSSRSQDSHEQLFLVDQQNFPYSLSVLKSNPSDWRLENLETGETTYGEDDIDSMTALARVLKLSELSVSRLGSLEAPLNTQETNHRQLVALLDKLFSDVQLLQRNSPETWLKQAGKIQSISGVALFEDEDLVLGVNISRRLMSAGYRHYLIEIDFDPWGEDADQSFFSDKAIVSVNENFIDVITHADETEYEASNHYYHFLHKFLGTVQAFPVPVDKS